MRTKKWGIALALLLSAAMLMPNTAFAQSGDEGQSFVEDLVEHPQTETEEKEVVAEKKSEAETKAENTEETVQPKQDKKEAVLSKESVAGKSLTILHTNDVHGHVAASSKDGKTGNIGYAKYAGIIAAKKAEGPVLVVDAGDLTQGTNFVTLSKGEAIINLANKIGVQAMVPGNHEFDYSLEQAKKNSKLAKYPWFASNIFDENGNLLFRAGEVIDVDGIKVGVFGLATPETKYKANPLNTKGLKFTDTVEETVKIAQAEIDKLLKRGADYTILLSHLGSDAESKVNTLKVVPQLKNLDLLIDGHSHTEWVSGHPFENGTLGASTGEHLKNVGIVHVVFGKDGTPQSKAELMNYAAAQSYKDDTKVAEIIAAFDKDNEKVLGQVVGTLAKTLDGERNHVRAGETGMGDLITDAMLKASGADAVITNGGGIRASINAGTVKVGDVFNVLPFGNAMTVIEVTGQDIIDALNYGISEYPNPAGKFPHVAGLTFKIAKKDNKNVATNIQIGKTAIDPAKTYKLATNDFMAVGGDGYEMFKGKNLLATHGSLAQIVQDYMTQLTKDGKGTFTYLTDGRVAEAKASEPTPSNKPSTDKPGTQPTDKPTTKPADKPSAKPAKIAAKKADKKAPKTGDVMFMAPVALLIAGAALTIAAKKKAEY